MPVRTKIIFFVSLLALDSPALRAQSGSFDVALQGQTVGAASYRIAPAAGGFASDSSVRVSTKGLEYAFSKTEKLSVRHEFQSAEINAVVNGSAVHLTVAPAGPEIAVNVSANGRATAAKLAAHPGAVFVPDFDPGALQTLVTLAEARNGRDLWLMIPHQAGSVEKVQVSIYADEKGTLDGKPIEVHHLVATCAGTTTHIFAGPAHQLLQAELPEAGFALVRKGFVLTPPAKAPAPPPTEDEGTPAPAAPSPTAPQTH